VLDLLGVGVEVAVVGDALGPPAVGDALGGPDEWSAVRDGLGEWLGVRDAWGDDPSVG
jgi:hypothetical protein